MQSHDLPFVVIPCVVMLGASAVYIAYDGSGSSIQRRVLTSAHGIVGTVLLLASIALAMVMRKPADPGSVFFALFHFAPLLLVLASLICYRGPKLIHLLQLLNVPALVWSSFLAYFYVFVRGV